jgi:hypothetical protein
MSEIEFTEEQQKFVDKLVGQARKEGRESGDAELKQKYDALKTVSDEREAELKKLKGEHKTASETLEQVLERRLEGYDEGVSAALETLPLDTMEKLKWIDEHGSLFTGSAGDGGEGTDKGPGTPKPSPKDSKPKPKPKVSRRVTF